MHNGLSPPLSHAIGSVIMLGIAYERDASVRRPDHPVNGREVDDLMAGSRTPAAANCEAGARSAGYRRMSPTCAPRGAFGMRSRAHDSTSLQEGPSRACTQAAKPSASQYGHLSTTGTYASNHICKQVFKHALRYVYKVANAGSAEALTGGNSNESCASSTWFMYS